jgi:hypothetical protein
VVSDKINGSLWPGLVLSNAIPGQAKNHKVKVTFKVACAINFTASLTIGLRLNPK